MAGVQFRTLCRCLFKQIEILHIPRQYTLSLINFIINYQGIFQTNSSIHNTKNKNHLHRAMPTYLVFKKLHSMLA